MEDTITLYSTISIKHDFLTVDMNDIYIDNGNMKIGVRVKKHEFLNFYGFATATIGKITIGNIYINLDIDRSIIEKYYKIGNRNTIEYDNRKEVIDNMIIGYINTNNLAYRGVPINILKITSYATNNNNEILCVIKCIPKTEPIIAKQYAIDKHKLMKQIEDLQERLKELL